MKSIENQFYAQSKDLVSYNNYMRNYPPYFGKRKSHHKRNNSRYRKNRSQGMKKIHNELQKIPKYYYY